MRLTMEKYFDSLGKKEVIKKEVRDIKKVLDEKKEYWKGQEFSGIFLEEFEKLSEDKKVLISCRIWHGFQCSVLKEQVSPLDIRPEYMGRYYLTLEQYADTDRKKRFQISFEKNLVLLDEILNELKTGLADEEKLTRWNDEMKEERWHEIETHMKSILAKLSNEELVAIAKNVLHAPEESRDLYIKLEKSINDYQYIILERILDIVEYENKLI